MSYFSDNLFLNCLCGYRPLGDNGEPMWYYFTGLPEDDSSHRKALDVVYRRTIENLIFAPNYFPGADNIVDFTRRTRRYPPHQTGLLGEAFVSGILSEDVAQLGLEMIQIDEDIAYQFRLTEDQDECDMAFRVLMHSNPYFSDEIFCFVCVKTSTSTKTNVKRSSAKCLETFTSVMSMNRPTVVIRIRSDNFDLDDPMGIQFKMRVNVERNFEYNLLDDKITMLT